MTNPTIASAPRAAGAMKTIPSLRVRIARAPLLAVLLHPARSSRRRHRSARDGPGTSTVACPLPVRPFFFIARPHTGRFFALLDGVLTPSSPHRERIIFHAGKKTCRHAYSYKARPRS